jgi:hypothetical protein
MNSRHRKTMLASIATVAVILLVFAAYRYSGPPQPTRGGLATDSSERQAAAPSGEAVALRPAGEKAAVGDDSTGGPDRETDEARVTIDVNEAGVRVVAVEATLREVLDGLVDKGLVEVSDLRPEEERLSDAAHAQRQSFRFSGAVDDVLHSVMDRYRYNYVLSGVPHSGAQAQGPLTKLFLHGTMRGEDAQSSASAGGVSAPDYAQSAPDNGSAPKTPGKEQATVTELLHERALSSVNRFGSTAGSKSTSGNGAAQDSAPISADPNDETSQARLAEMTRKASEQVRALAEQLKAAEKSLEMQQANQYGDTQP